MVLNIQKHDKNKLAALDAEGGKLTYSDLIKFSDEFYEIINKRTFIFILSENTVGSLAGYVASLNNNVVPLMLSSELDPTLLQNLIELYKPEYLWVPRKSPIISKVACVHQLTFSNYVLLKLYNPTPDLYYDLSLLLSTSGSTGSPKLVRHSYGNIWNNAKNVADFFELSPEDRPIAMLPMHYTMGLSLVTSHLFAGATVLLTSQNLTSREFWVFLKENLATSFTGIPFSFEILQKLRFFRMDLPHLELISQGGGKLNDKLFEEIANYAKNNDKRFIATYGQTEGTARMSFLSPQEALNKIGSIGKAIPNGEFLLIDTEEQVIREDETVGELVYKGPNVTLGYATTLNDLTKGDEREGILRTGDLAKRDKDGYFYIVGRKNRFLKIYGTRYGLDEIENLIQSEFEIGCHCTGSDQMLEVFMTGFTLTDVVEKFLIEKIGIFHKALNVNYIETIPRNEYGKVLLF
jgi:acyl-coenzyme A synthetase/AMP-(fatty) acid ligase